jgi:uncharacterized membrane protein YuzA (DUF378 family)
MALKRIALFLALLGGINWGLVGAFKFDLVTFVFGFLPVLVPIVQIVIGVAACYALFAYMIK